MTAVAKADSTYHNALHSLGGNYKLNPCDEGTTMSAAWEVVLAGFGSIGNEHAKMMEELNSSATELEKWRKKESEDKRKVHADAAQYVKELSAYESVEAKAKKNYHSHMKNVELAVQKRDEALNDPKLKDNVLKLTQKVGSSMETFLGTFLRYDM